MCKKYKLLWFFNQVDAWKWSLVSVNTYDFVMPFWACPFVYDFVILWWAYGICQWFLSCKVDIIVTCSNLILLKIPVVTYCYYLLLWFDSSPLDSQFFLLQILPIESIWHFDNVLFSGWGSYARNKDDILLLLYDFVLD